MDFKTELAQMRQRFAQSEAQIKQEVKGEAVEPAMPESIWADEIEMPTPGMGMQSPEVFSGEVEMPNVLTDTDGRFTGDPEQDNMAFQQYMMEDPMMKQYGPEMEALLEEIVEQVNDPENPLTEEEAQKLFLEMMEEQFGQYFK